MKKKPYLEIQLESLKNPKIKKWREKVQAKFLPQFYEFTGLDLSKMKVLVCACGSGFEVEPLQTECKELLGIDIDKESVKYCSKNFKGKFMVGDAENLKFKDNEFDLVVSCYTLEHVNNWKKALHEIIRVGKKAYIKVPNGFYPDNHKPEENAKKINPFAFVKECKKYGKIKVSWGPFYWLKPTVTVYLEKYSLGEV